MHPLVREESWAQTSPVNDEVLIGFQSPVSPIRCSVVSVFGELEHPQVITFHIRCCGSFRRPVHLAQEWLRVTGSMITFVFHEQSEDDKTNQFLLMLKRS